MSRYEFSFVVTEVELSEEQRLKVGRAIAMAGAAELGTETSRELQSQHHFSFDERLVRFWCGIPPVIELSAAASNALRVLISNDGGPSQGTQLRGHYQR